MIAVERFLAEGQRLQDSRSASLDDYCLCAVALKVAPAGNESVEQSRGDVEQNGRHENQAFRSDFEVDLIETNRR